MNIAALRRAVKMAAEWRGSLTGDPDPEPLERFDAEIERQRQAVLDTDRMRRGVKHAIARCDAAGEHTIAQELRELL